MKRSFWLQLVVSCVLLLAAASGAQRLLQRVNGGRLDLGGDDPGTLRPGTRAELAGLERRVALTYFVSGRPAMPAAMRGVEPAVRRLLAALERGAPERLDVRILDPELGGARGRAYAARHRVAPVEARRVVHDEHAQQAIWSSLVIAAEGAPEALIQDLEPRDLPHLEALIAAHLRALREPVRPLFAVAGAAPHRRLAALLAQAGRVVEVDLERQASIPPAADVLFWVQPAVVTPAHLQALARFVEAGRTVVLAGSSYTVDYVADPGGSLRFRARRLGDAWPALLRELGLGAPPDLLLDESAGTVLVETGGAGVAGSSAGGSQGDGLQPVTAPFHLRCLPGCYDLRRFRGAARGALDFVAAAPLELDAPRLRAAGFRAAVIATTTEHAQVAALPRGDFTAGTISGALPVAKQNLAVLLEPDDPWRGRVLVLASASLLEDGIIDQPGYAHRVFLRTLLRNVAAPEALLRNRLPRGGPPALPPVGARARLAWRLLVAGLLPGLLLALALWRARPRSPRPAAAGPGGLDAWLPPPRAQRGWRTAGITAFGLAGLVALALASRSGRARGPQLDVTRGRANTPAALTRRVLAGERGALTAELLISPRAALPLALEPLAPRLARLFGGAGLAFTTRHPEDLPAAQLARLPTQGIAPFEVRAVVGDTLAPRMVWSALRLARRGRTAVIPHLDARRATDLEFLLVSAIARLQRGRAPSLALVAGLPRLSPAEAYENYQSQGLIAPAGTDVYSRLRALLRESGYRVTYVDPRAPALPPDTDVVVWLQPRRDSSAMQLLLSEHLARGGKAIVALQHFNIQQRQYRGAGFATVYWPQPQFQDAGPWLALYGVQQVREVLMDRTRADLELETQVHRAAISELDPQEVARPFLIRTVSGSYAAGSPVTHNLGDLHFIWGNRFTLDAAHLRACGLEARVLVATSPRAWAYDWHGGWLPAEIFDPQRFLDGPQPLVVELRGRFPPVRPAAAGNAAGNAASNGAGNGAANGGPLEGTAAPGAPPGRLLLIGCSEMFTNAHLEQPGYAHARLMLNAVASMAYEPELAALQSRQPAPPGLPYLTPRAKAGWRALVLLAGPLALLLAHGAARRWGGGGRGRPPGPS